ncbi:NERD domain-containing protein [Caldisericum exile]|uniref:nuclease-related domain-containing protein n=1 Tax=Caldisericum exile TaxID=693075 RepID=UPI003C7817F6
MNMFKRKRKQETVDEAGNSKRTLLEEKIRELYNDLFDLDFIQSAFLLSFLLATFFLIIILFSYSKYKNTLFWLYLVITPLYILISVVSFKALNKFMRRLKSEYDIATKEREDEQKVQKYLKENPTDDYHVFENIYTGYGDIDAVVVGPTEIFMIEIKSNEGIVSEDTNGYLSVIEGNAPNKNYMEQVAKELGQVKKYLDNNTNMRVWVTPVLVFPFGSVIKNLVLESDYDKFKLPVMNEKDLLKHIYSNNQNQLTSEQIGIVVNALEEWQRD